MRGFYIYFVLIMYLILFIIIIIFYFWICFMFWYWSMLGEVLFEIEKCNEIMKWRVVCMFVIIIVVFVFCWFLVYFFYLFIVYCFDVLLKFLYYVMIFCFWLGYVNSVVNLWLYMMLNEKFCIVFSVIVCGRDLRMWFGLNRI